MFKNPSYKCVILANPEGKRWDFARRVYEDLRSRSEDYYELNEVDITTFRNGERKPKIRKNVRLKNCFFIHDSNLPPEIWWTDLMMVNYTLRHSSAHEIIDILPRLFYSRQDRKDDSRVPNTSKIIADCISKYANRVYTFDVHSSQTQGFYGIPFDSFPTSKKVVEYLKTHHPLYSRKLSYSKSRCRRWKKSRGFC